MSIDRSGFSAFARAMNKLYCISLTAALSVCAVSGSAAAQTDYDGFWSVDVVALDGACGTGTIGLEVRDGAVAFVGFGATAEGAIGSNGLLRANIKHGDNVVRAKGALKGEIGRGSWTSSECAGQWTARRK